MARFTSRTFRKHVSKKSRKFRQSKKAKQSKVTRRLPKQRKQRKQSGGGDTFSRRIPAEAVIANPLEWDDKPDA